MSPLNELRDEAFANAKAKGFHRDLQVLADLRTDDHYPQEMVDVLEARCWSARVALLHSEPSELLEVIRKGHQNVADEKVPELSQEEAEVADIIIRALDYAGSRGLDVDRAVRVKMAFNRTRPHQHGGKRL